MWVPHYGGLSLFNLIFLELFLCICKCNKCLTGAVLSFGSILSKVSSLLRLP